MPAQKACNRNNRLKIKSGNIALCGILLALSAGISAAESMIPLPMGVKPGFSNLPVMFSMTVQGAKYGFAICVLKSLFVLMTRGVTAFFMSLVGGMLSYIIMLFIYKKTKVSIMLMSILGALMHNFAQLCTASLILHTAVFGYGPVMAISGCAAGAAVGAVLKLLLNASDRICKNLGGN